MVRENQTGAIWEASETDLNVPGPEEGSDQAEFGRVLASRKRSPNTAKTNRGDINPLVRDGQEWVPNIPHVFRQDQHLYISV